MLAWLSGLVVPCTEAEAHEPIVTNVEVAGGHDDCHGAHSAATLSDDNCCCDVTTAATGSDLQKLQNITVLYAAPATHDFLKLALFQTVIVQEHGPPLHETSPPVYLTTQRFRI